MKTLALFAAAVLVVLGLAQPDPKRAVLRPVLMSPQQSSTTIVPAPPAPPPAPFTPPKKEAWLEDVEKTLRDSPTSAEPTPAPPPSRQVGLEPPTTIIIEEKPKIGVPLEPRVPNQANTTSADLFVVKTQRLNVRTGASAKAQKIGELLQGEEVTAVISLYGNEVDGWIEITARNGMLHGWVKKSLLKAQPARP